MSSYDDAREAAVQRLLGHRHLREMDAAKSDADAVIETFLASLSETHAVVPRDEIQEAFMADVGGALFTIGYEVLVGKTDHSKEMASIECAQALWPISAIAAMLAQEVKP